MNLADAIRQAAVQRGEPVLPTPPLSVATDPTPTAPAVPAAESAPNVIHMPEIAPNPTMPDPPSPVVNGGNVVRLELFLAPEQLHSLFRSVVATQHSVMTLREAATFLRIAPHILEQMAIERQIPAFQVDGKWRFPRGGIDEWLSQRTTQREVTP